MTDAVRYRAVGNAATADSTAALSFASIERMPQSMAAVKMTEKREVLLMIRFLSSGRKSVFEKLCSIIGCLRMVIS